MEDIYKVIFCFLQPAEKECLAETANNHVALTWTARGFVFACQTLTAAPAPAAGLGLAVRRVSARTPTSYLPAFSLFGTLHVTDFFSFCQPALMTCMDQTANWAVNARMVEFASVSVDAHVPQGGEDKAVRNRVGFTLYPLVHYFQQHASLYHGSMRRTSWAPKLGQNVHFF